MPAEMPRLISDHPAVASVSPQSHGVTQRFGLSDCKALCAPLFKSLKDTHTHPFNGPFFGTTRVRWYQKGKTNLDFTEARESEWQWHPLGHM